MPRVTTIFSFGLILLLAGSANSAPAETECREFFFQDFFLDPWRIPAENPPPESASEGESVNISLLPVAALTTPSAAIAAEAQEQETTFPLWSILFLGLAIIVFSRAITLPLWSTSGRVVANRKHALRAKRKKVRRLQKTYRLREQTTQFRQELKEALELPPGATDRDISRALQDCNSEIISTLNNDQNRFR